MHFAPGRPPAFGLLVSQLRIDREKRFLLYFLLISRIS
jgi:hypothetical protein